MAASCMVWNMVWPWSGTTGGSCMHTAADACVRTSKYL
jgi:hypothetical protein